MRRLQWKHWGCDCLICTDKTGTLTRNEMTVQSVMTADYQLQVSGVGYVPLDTAAWGALLHSVYFYFGYRTWEIPVAARRCRRSVMPKYYPGFVSWIRVRFWASWKDVTKPTVFCCFDLHTTRRSKIRAIGRVTTSSLSSVLPNRKSNLWNAS